MKAILAIVLLLGYLGVALVIGYGVFAAFTWAGFTLAVASWLSGAITGSWFVVGALAYAILYHEL